MKITRDEARRIATLAHLEFDDDALDRLAGEMTAILAYIDKLREADVADDARAKTPSPQILRADVVRGGVDQGAVERNAPDWDNGFFVVPKVIE